jgi:hypothetical protein
MGLADRPDNLPIGSVSMLGFPFQQTAHFY